MPTTTRFITNRMCPYAQKAWLALELDGRDYTLEEISLYGPNGKPDFFWELNPAGTVPVMVSCNDVVCDSEDILDYLNVDGEDTDGGEGGEEGVAYWRSLVKNKISPVGKRAVFASDPTELFALLVGNEDAGGGVDGKIVGPYLCGAVPSSADCAAFPFFWRIESEFGFPAECNKLKSWLNTCLSNPKFKKTVQKSWWWWW
eukprot:CAMPEP_0113320168 /NCGR_PEP_ID=MMETSP0010_2-20120614/14076_1 /TAXON_ID=216773 ORGANISM="Corethron hystrix, Strain 308" /NCGR_SAMPLE_ID=MMETSP0010_2 /ASSEMBLY_ACC=CAM_ASM_000155 /LENGTH=200 /DNA_ID=CAMNT_0000177879 /DNA_START=270 /DNA_END=872 /DNA_ORIENTATION=+ /assembly_acc=CAM_ASM_000155